MDTQLRTRLIGAAVLFGLLAIFLPMFLNHDDANDPAGDDPLRASETQQIPLDIPAQPEPGMQTRVLPIDPVAPAADVPASAENNPADPMPVPPAVPPVASDTQGVIPRNDGTAETTTSAPDLAISNSQEPNNNPVVDQPTSAPTMALPKPVDGGRFGVNFGSYGSQVNAEKLIDQLASSKIKARLEAVPDKNLFRVAIRGLASRGDAEKIRLVAQDAISGLNASILQAELANETAPSVVRPENVKAFAIQIGVFADKIKAAELIGKLKSKGFAAYADNLTTPSGSSVRVRVGPVIRRADADQMRGDIKSKTGLDGIVVSQ